MSGGGKKRISGRFSVALRTLLTVVDHELTGGKGALDHETLWSADECTHVSQDTHDHDETRAHAGEQTGRAELLRKADEAGRNTLSWGALSLVDLGQEGVGGLRDLRGGGGGKGDVHTVRCDVVRWTP